MRGTAFLEGEADVMESRIRAQFRVVPALKSIYFIHFQYYFSLSISVIFLYYLLLLVISYIILYIGNREWPSYRATG